MASSYDATCPGCGGRAHWNTDDGITYCDNFGPTGCAAKAEKAGKSTVGSGMHVEDSSYKPPSRRGG